MKKTIVVLLTAPLLIISCTPTKTIIDTSCPGYKNQNFNRSKISQYGIGIMPVLGGEDKEQYRRPMGNAINTYFINEFGIENVKQTQEVIKILNDEGLTDEYTIALNDYNISGIVPKDMVNEVGNALNVKYLLYSRLLSDTEIGTVSIGRTSQVVSVDEIYVQCQVWDTEVGDVAWEGKGGVAKLPQNDSDVIEKTAEGLSKIIGNELGVGPCEKKQELIRSMQTSYTNTYFVVLIGVSALTLIILLI